MDGGGQDALYGLIGDGFIFEKPDAAPVRLVKLLGEQSMGKCPRNCDGQRFLCVNALARKLGVTQSAVSQHLRVLRHAGLVRGVRHGAFMHCSLDASGLERYQTSLTDTLGESFSAG